MRVERSREDCRGVCASERVPEARPGLFIELGLRTMIGTILMGFERTTQQNLRSSQILRSAWMGRCPPVMDVARPRRTLDEIFHAHPRRNMSAFEQQPVVHSTRACHPGDHVSEAASASFDEVVGPSRVHR